METKACPGGGPVISPAHDGPRLGEVGRRNVGANKKPQRTGAQVLTGSIRKSEATRRRPHTQAVESDRGFNDLIEPMDIANPRQNGPMI